jgi:hypothetical protein
MDLNETEFNQAKLFITEDIRREIELAKASVLDGGKRSILDSWGMPSGGGNLLVGLGLLCYTEFCGYLHSGPSGGNRQRFDAFFRELGPKYIALLDEKDKNGAKHNIYGIFRCGFAHQYFATREFTVVMPTPSPDPDLAFKYDPGRHHYTFYVVTYYEHLVAALGRLGAKLKGTYPIKLDGH